MRSLVKLKKKNSKKIKCHFILLKLTRIQEKTKITIFESPEAKKKNTKNERKIVNIDDNTVRLFI